MDNFDNFSFVMQINDVYNFNNGVMIGGPILKGDIKENDTIYYVDANTKIESVVGRLEVFGRMGDGTAHCGEYISIVQPNIKKEHITGNGYIVAY